MTKPQPPVAKALQRLRVDREGGVLRRLLREARLSAGLRQRDLAERLRLPQSFVSKYESGERRLDVLELRHVCIALGMSFRKFVQQLDERIASGD